MGAARHNPDMWGKIRDFLLRTLPYIISIAGGIVLFSISLDNVHDPAVEGLISNISASLLAIPLVFLLYDYTTKRVSRRLQETLVANMNDRINTIILHVVLILRKMLKMRGRLTSGGVMAMRGWTEGRIVEKMQIRGEYIDLLRQYYEELENLIIGFGKENAMTPDQVSLMSALARDMSRLVAMHSLGGNRRIVARHIKNIIGEINDWLDSGAIVSKKFDAILSAATTPSQPAETKKRKSNKFLDFL
ncbi:MAG: hypothetical protein IJQ90_03785 [Alphaproteobacteria bacterium]|nr:hypothetical protein [Alphaproteobacteria bacterium]